VCSFDWVSVGAGPDRTFFNFNLAARIVSSVLTGLLILRFFCDLSRSAARGDLPHSRLAEV